MYVVLRCGLIMLAAVYCVVLMCLLAGATAGRGHERCSINTWLQSVMYHWVAVPVLKARWAVIGQFSFSAISVLKYLSSCSFTVSYFD